MPAEEKSFVECNEWIKQNTPPDAIVLSRKPYYTELMAGRKSVGYLNSEDPAAQLDHIVANGAGYIIAGDLKFYIHEKEQLINTVNRYKEKFTLLYTTKSVPEDYVYRVSD